MPGCLSWAALLASRRNRAASSGLARWPALGILMATWRPSSVSVRPEDVAERAHADLLEQLESAEAAQGSHFREPGRRAGQLSLRSHPGKQGVGDGVETRRVFGTRHRNPESNGSEIASSRCRTRSQETHCLDMARRAGRARRGGDRRRRIVPARLDPGNPSGPWLDPTCHFRLGLGFRRLIEGGLATLVAETRNHYR